jgi:hypothetical protein
MKAILIFSLFMIATSSAFGQTKALKTVSFSQPSFSTPISQTPTAYLTRNLNYVGANGEFRVLTFKKQAERIYFVGPVFGPRPTPAVPYSISSMH